MIDANNLFLHAGGDIVPALEDRVAAAVHCVVRWEDASVKQSRCVGIDHAGWDCIAGEGAALNDTRGCGPAGAISKQVRRVDVSSRGNVGRGTTCHVAVVPSGIGHGLVQRLTLNQAAPFHVVKEERLVLFGPEINWTADVKAESVEPKFGDVLRSRVEIVASVKRVVAQELPSAGMILLGSGLDDSGHRGAEDDNPYSAL